MPSQHCDFKSSVMCFFPLVQVSIQVADFFVVIVGYKRSYWEDLAVV